MNDKEFSLMTFLAGVDALLGGDVQGSAKERFLLDHFFSGEDFPPIYNDPIAVKMRYEGGGIGNCDPADVADFVGRYDMYDFSRELATGFGADQAYVNHLVGAADVMMRTMVALSRERELPSFDERYHASTLRDVVTLIDPTPVREQLREALDQEGYSSRPETVRETFLRWRADRAIPKEEFATRCDEAHAALFPRYRAMVRFADISLRNVPWIALADVPFDRHRLTTIANQSYTGFSLYQGGSDTDGNPTLEGCFEYNIDHPVTLAGLRHIWAHEVLGHYGNVITRDVRWRSGHLSFLATFGTMCTNETAYQEGLAEAMLELLYGSEEAVAESLGSQFKVVFRENDLQNIAKHNVSLLHQREGWDVDRVKQYVAKDCVQPDSIVDKMSRGWTTHPIFGPMYGPAYALGLATLRDVMKQHDKSEIVSTVFYNEGLMDLSLFQKRFAVR